jgi:hypothetical protein
MRMDDQHGESFDQLRKLLAIKKHEAPPPGYFDRFSGDVVSRIRMEINRARRMDNDAAFRVGLEAPWLLQLWETLAGKPMFAGAFGAVICSLMLAGIYFTNKPASTPNLATQGHQNVPFMAVTPDAASSTLNKPLLMAATNLNEATIPNLFDMAPQLQYEPAALQPNY